MKKHRTSIIFDRKSNFLQGVPEQSAKSINQCRPSICFEIDPRAPEYWISSFDLDDDRLTQKSSPAISSGESFCHPILSPLCKKGDRSEWFSLSLAGGRACSLRDQHTQHHHVQRLSLNTKSSPLSLKRFCVFRFALSFHHRTQKSHARNKVVRRSATLFE